MEEKEEDYYDGEFLFMKSKEMPQAKELAHELLMRKSNQSTIVLVLS